MTKSHTFVNACLILKRQDEVLLYLRQNTGFLDGFYGLVAGHVEAGESATQAIIREAREEAGIEIEAKDLAVKHVAHRLTNRYNIDVYFECERWKGEIRNVEPHKCGEMVFFPASKLPENTIEHIAYVLKAIDLGSLYSEHGWI